MLSKELKTWDYYRKKLPLYVQSSYGFSDQFKIIWGLLKELDDCEDNIVNSFGVMLLSVEDIKKRVKEGKSLSDILNSDVINTVGELVGLNRFFSFVYKEGLVEHKIDTKDYGGLNDLQFLRYIQIKLLNLQYDGSTKSLNKAYRETKIGNHKFNIPIYFTQSSEPATCEVFLLKSGDSSKDFDELEEMMFKAGIYDIEYLGVKHNYTIVSSSVGLWDSNNGVKGMWDKATWG